MSGESKSPKPGLEPAKLAPLAVTSVIWVGVGSVWWSVIGLR